MQFLQDLNKIISIHADVPPSKFQTKQKTVRISWQSYANLKKILNSMYKSVNPIITMRRKKIMCEFILSTLFMTYKERAEALNDFRKIQMKLECDILSD